MRIRNILATTAVAAGLGFAAPALSQPAVDIDVDVEDVQIGGQVVDDGAGNVLNSGDYDNIAVFDYSSTLVTSSDGNIGNDNAIAVQELTSVIGTSGDELIDDFDNLVDDDYESGDNAIGGGAFSAFAGVLSQAWNTGLLSNTQSANNIAARGTTTFTADDLP